MPEYEEIVLYRFRVRTADGREAVSRIAAVPVKDGQLQRDDARVLAGASPEPDQAQLEAKLANPRWSGDSFQNGERAIMQVDAPGLDGHSVRFTVEHLLTGTWSTYATLTAPVENGVASATLQLHHPGEGEQQDSPADLRFTCELA